jgi:hypothetical protein
MMPSIGVATGIVIRDRINRMVREEFPEENVRKDAFRMIGLSAAAPFGRAEKFSALLMALVPMTFFFVGWADPQYERLRLAAVIFSPLPVIFYIWIKRSAMSARREMHALLTANPEYWGPILDKSREIILKAGDMRGSMFPRSQATRIVTK